MLTVAGLERIRTRIEPVRVALIEHPVYRQIQGLPALRIFMQHHVFAVWDFMSLLKGLQRQITCVEVPWLPPAHALGARLVNEIVLGEESDEDGRGGFASHFELYRRAMGQCGASTLGVDRLLAELRAGQPMARALDNSQVPDCVQRFVQQSFAVLNTGDLPALASAFTFGREDLLPTLFERIVCELNQEVGGDLDDFIFYLRRHIELDGDHHGPLAQQLIVDLCGTDAERWEAAAGAAEAALEARLDLWNGIEAAIAAER